MINRILVTIHTTNPLSEEHLGMLVTDISSQCDSIEVYGSTGYAELLPVLSDLETDSVRKLVGLGPSAFGAATHKILVAFLGKAHG